jgi:Phage capsid protein
MSILKFLRAFLSYAGFKLADQTGAITIPMAWVHAFHAQLLQIMQQTTSLVRANLLPKVSRSGVTGAIDTWERVGNVLLQPVPHHGQTIPLNPNHTRRGATMQTMGGAIYLQPNIDVVRMLIQPQSDYRDLLAAAAVQTIDKAILDGSIGTATTITTSATTGQITYGSQAMLTAYQIGAATAMDLTRIIAANVLLSKASVPNGASNRVFFYSPGQETDIMAITQASSSDFTKNRLHDAGTMDGYDWQGFHWVQIPDVVDEATTVLQRMLQISGTSRYCIAMYRGGVGYSSAQDPQTSIDPRHDLNNLIQVYLSFTMGVVRLWEGAVVRVQALEN